jgi:signal peptidase I
MDRHAHRGGDRRPFPAFISDSTLLGVLGGDGPDVKCQRSDPGVKGEFPLGVGKNRWIIVFQHRKRFSCGPVGTTAQDLVERVIGLPGQTISSSADTIYVDKKILSEPGGYNAPYGQLGSKRIAPTKIAPGQYFVMGDNRIDSCDSRAFGPIPGALIVGKAVAIIVHDGHPHLHAL